VVPAKSGTANIMTTKENADSRASIGTARSDTAVRTFLAATSQKGAAAAYITAHVDGLR